MIESFNLDMTSLSTVLFSVHCDCTWYQMCAIWCFRVLFCFSVRSKKTLMHNSYHISTKINWKIDKNFALATCCYGNFQTHQNIRAYVQNDKMYTLAKTYNRQQNNNAICTFDSSEKKSFEYHKMQKKPQNWKIKAQKESKSISI